MGKKKKPVNYLIALLYWAILRHRGKKDHKICLKVWTHFLFLMLHCRCGYGWNDDPECESGEIWAFQNVEWELEIADISYWEVWKFPVPTWAWLQHSQVWIRNLICVSFLFKGHKKKTLSCVIGTQMCIYSWVVILWSRHIKLSFCSFFFFGLVFIYMPFGLHKKPG